MANESSTKPTYSELAERLCAEAMVESRVHPGSFVFDTRKAEEILAEYNRAYITRWAKETESLLAELARVRGLLQRQWISVEERLPEDDDTSVWVCFENGSHYCSARLIEEEWWGYNLETEDTFQIEQKITHWMPLHKLSTFPQSSSLVSQGAESADIGKLDTADKSGVEMGKVNSAWEQELQIVRVLRACGKTMNGGQFQNFVTHIVIPLVEHHWPASAETGGEKAIGICTECHEEIGYWCMHQAWRDESGNQMFRHSINCTAPAENSVALAESSLSSPPHTHETDKINNCWACIGERLRETGNITTYRSPELLPTQLDPEEKE